MISRLRGSLLTREGERVEVATPGGVVYELDVPLSVAERLPALGENVELLTVQVIRPDAQALYGFLDPLERAVFLKLLSAPGVGSRLALAMLATYRAPRLVRALVERDVAALVQVSGVGRKRAEKLVVELSDRMKDLDLAARDPEGSPSVPSAVHAAVQALVVLGMSFEEADTAVRSAFEDGKPMGTDELVRRALAAR